MGLRRNIGGVSDADILINAFSTGSGAVTVSSTPQVPLRVEQMVTTPLSETPIDTALPPAHSNRGVIIGAVVTAAAVYAVNKNKSVGGTGGKKRSLLFPLLLVGGAAAYWFYQKQQTTGNDEQQDYSSGSGVLNVEPSVHAAYAQRIVAHGSNWPTGNAIYAAVLKAGLPSFAAVIDSMPINEQMALYHLVNDYPQSSLDSSDPNYTTLVNMRSKYGLTFY